MPPSRLTPALAVAALVLLVAAAPAAARKGPAIPTMPQTIPSVDYEGKQVLEYKLGPIEVKPGQNTIDFADNNLKPDVPGYITRFEPNLVRDDGTVPPVDELHLHHGVWLMRAYPTFAAGEEKTVVQIPRGFGYRYDPSDRWVMNHMIHNLLPNRDRAWLTYKIDFVPMDSPAAQDIKEVKPLWMDVAGIAGYPVFDVKRSWGRNGTYTFPDDARGAERKKIGFMQKWTTDKPITLVGSAGHLHPGGLHTTLDARRGGGRRELFRSEARYWEPAGPVSWDMAMTVTDPDWKVALNAGDQLEVKATYETRRASWYESMGIQFAWYHEGHDVGGVDPFVSQVRTRGRVTHGQLEENRNKGGRRGALPDPRKLLPGPFTSRVTIEDFIYGRGDLGMTGRTGRPPSVRQGGQLTFRNLDSDKSIWHTITACREPCNQTTGVAFPLADGRVDFDSGELGYGPSFATPAANRDTWRTPKNLRPGTYAYFCRVHPFMRGSFRVRARKRTAAKRPGAPAGRRTPAARRG
jgi:hypothetical protein